ncbi:hypothetical protein IAR55_001645 [Kwoniella newhampshirensis]|uniref:RING-type domain-containing protein n=1 Tax=Kwoniella newhampshirensis TaxID=1651941 RepID=A0AAW0Z2Y5_9TREE
MEISPSSPPSNPAKAIPIRVKISNIILKKGSPFHPPSSPSITLDTMPESEDKQDSKLPPEMVQETMEERFVILGPDPPRYMELSSSEGSSGTAKTARLRTESPLKLTGRHSAQQLSAVYKCPPSPTTGASIQGKDLSPSSLTHGEIDWVEYSAPIEELEDWIQTDGDSQWTGTSWSDRSDKIGPMIITPTNSQAHRPMSVTVQDITNALNPPSIRLTLSTPPHSPVRLPRASKSPDLPAIDSQRSSVSQYDEDESRNQDDVRDSSRLLVLKTNLKVFREDEEGEMPKMTNALEAEWRCAACGRSDRMDTGKRMVPCGDLTCSSCFSSSLSAVSVTGGHSKCPKCFKTVLTFQLLVPASESLSPKHFFINNDGRSPIPYPSPTAKKVEGGSVVMRIDNIAWDLTPAVVEQFLPSNSLSKHVPQAVHVLLDRFDGRTKDYLYIEARSREAAQLILKTRNNTFMPGGPLTGGRKRPVTITLVSHEELIAELRPRSSQELHTLLGLCQAATSPIPNGAARFVKSRHGPYHALLSIMSKLTGKQSPAYWDLFHVASGQSFHLLYMVTDKQLLDCSHLIPSTEPAFATSRMSYPTGAITTLSNAITAQKNHYPPSPSPAYTPANNEEDDEVMRDKLLKMFGICFGLSTEN